MEIITHLGYKLDDRQAIDKLTDMTRCDFPNLGDDPHKTYPVHVDLEFRGCYLNTLSPEHIKAKRCGRYWCVRTLVPLYYTVAKEINDEHGDTIRAFGYATGMRGSMFDTRCTSSWKVVEKFSVENWNNLRNNCADDQIQEILQQELRNQKVTNIYWHVDTVDGLRHLAKTLKRYLGK